MLFTKNTLNVLGQLFHSRIVLMETGHGMVKNMRRSGHFTEEQLLQFTLEYAYFCQEPPYHLQLYHRQRSP